MKNELATIHNYLMRIEVKGDSAICLAEAIVRLRRLIEQPDETSITNIEEILKNKEGESK